MKRRQKHRSNIWNLGIALVFGILGHLLAFRLRFRLQFAAYRVQRAHLWF